MMSKRTRGQRGRWTAFCLALLIPMALSALASAQQAPKKFPVEPVKIIVPQKAGGSNDLIARSIQPFLAKYLGVPVVVDNVEGAGGKIGRVQAYKAKADGYTLVLAGTPSAYLGQKTAKVDYVFEKMTPVYNITGDDYNGAAVAFDSPIKTLDDLKKLSLQKNVKIAGSGIGNNSHLSFYLLRTKAGVRATYVPYNSSAEGAMAVVSKEVDACTGALLAWTPLVEQKRIRVILTFGPERSKFYPEVSTMIEQGYPGSGYDVVMGLYGPPGIPSDVVKILADAAEKAMAESAFKDIAKRAELSLAPLGPSVMKKTMEEQIKMIDEIAPTKW